MSHCRSFALIPAFCLLAISLGACGSDNPALSADQPAIVLRDSASNSGGGGTAPVGMGVNSYLWRASLDTVSFMPLASADPFGGVIISDWYSPPETPNERFKLNIYILDRELHADGVKATVFHQTKNPDGTWTDAPVDARTAGNLENQILTRARQLRIASAESATVK